MKCVFTKEKVEAEIEAGRVSQSNFIPLNVKITIKSGSLAGKNFTVQISPAELENMLIGTNQKH